MPPDNPNKLSAKLRRSIRRDQKEFVRLLEENSPKIDTQKVFTRFNKYSQKTAERLVQLATRSLAFINAVHYANESLISSLGAENTAFDTNDIGKQLERVLEIRFIELLCQEFKIDKKYEDALILGIINARALKALRGKGFSISDLQKPGKNTETIDFGTSGG